MAQLLDLSIVRHTLGLNEFGEQNCKRNHFVTEPGGHDGRLCQQLCDAGYMVDCGLYQLATGMRLYRATTAGELAARETAVKRPILTRSQRRYQSFLDADSGLTFGEWLQLQRKAKQ